MPEPLATWARALAAAAILGGDATRAALARIAGPAGDAARQLAASWQAKDRRERARAAAAVAAEVRAPVPAHADRVDRVRLAARMGDDPRARAAWAHRASPAADPVAVWWRRRITAGWVALPAADPAAALAAPGDVARWPTDRIVALCRRIGFAAIAHVAQVAGPAAVAQLAASAGAAGPELVAVARELATDAALRGALGSARGAASRVSAIEVRDPAAPTRLGAGVLGACLAAAGDDALAQVAMIVPAALADVLVRERDLRFGWDAIARLADRGGDDTIRA